jgi:hypothetical protein
MNIPYLLQTLKTDKLSELVANIDLPPLDMNLAIWEAVDRGEIELDEENDKVQILVKEIQPTSDQDIRNKILRVIQHYTKNGTNVTRGRLNGQVQDPMTGKNFTEYPYHEYIMAIQHLIDGELVKQYVVEVPAQVHRFVDKKGRKKEKVERPGHVFAFLGLTEYEKLHEEWNAAAVNKWIADFTPNTVQ